MEKKAVGRSVFISACKKSSVGVLREQSEPVSSTPLDVYKRQAHH